MKLNQKSEEPEREKDIPDDLTQAPTSAVSNYVSHQILLFGSHLF